jgi:hypothetical protein
MNRILLAALVSTALSVAGCGSFNVEASQPQACLQLVSPQAFIPVPPVILGGTGKLTASVDLGLKNAFPGFLVDGSPDNNVVRFLGATLALNGPPGSDTRWVTGIKVTATNPSLPPLVLVDYTPPAGAPTGAVFSIGPRDPNNNLVTMLQNGGLTLEVETTYNTGVAIPPPTGLWSAGVNVCLSASVKKTFQELIDGK